MTTDTDPLIEELLRDRHDRSVLVIAAAIGIIVGLTLGMAMFVGALDAAVDGERDRNHDALAYFLTPLVASMSIGYALYVRRCHHHAR